MNDITGRLKAMFLGSMLGDGSLVKETELTASFTERHAMGQKELVQWKHEIWGDRSGPIASGKQSNPNAQDWVGFRVRSSADLLPWRQLFYGRSQPSCDGKTRKLFPPEITYDLTPLALAVWYMDDGNAGFKPSLSAHRRNHDVGLGYLREFGLTGVGVPCGSDRIEFKDEKQADRFLRIVEPHIIPSMRYKLEPECARLGTKIDGRKLQEAVDAGLTIAALMAEFKCAREPLKSKLAELGILHEVSELNPGASSDLSDRVIHERRHVTGRDLLVLPEDLLRDLVGTGASARQIAQRFGVHKNIVKRYLVKYGLPVPQARGGHRWTATEHVDVEMVRAGRIAGRTVQSLADEVGVRTSTLRNFMTRQGLD